MAANIPAAIIGSVWTAAPAAASSTATPYDSGNIIVWSPPGFPVQKATNGTQSYSTSAGQTFADFNSGVLVPMPGQLPTTPATLALVEGTPQNND